MFNNTNRDIPQSINECVRIDSISNEIWQWSAGIEKFGKVLMWIIIVCGFIISIAAGVIVDAYGDAESWSFLTFFVSLIDYGIYAFITYLIYRTIALLTAALASITQNTRISARLAEYEARLKENDFGQTIHNTPSGKRTSAGASSGKSTYDLSSLASTYTISDTSSQASQDTWICPMCGETNNLENRACFSCGNQK